MPQRAVFPDEHIRRALEHLGITDDDFDEMLRLLEYRMRQDGVEEDDAGEALAGYRRLRGDVVSNPDQLEPVGR